MPIKVFCKNKRYVRGKDKIKREEFIHYIKEIGIEENIDYELIYWLSIIHVRICKKISEGAENNQSLST